MRVTPIAAHAAVRVPELTSVFSDDLPVQSMTVVAGGKTTAVCTHSFTVGDRIGVCVTKAPVPTKIVGATLDTGLTTFETEFPHDMAQSVHGFKGDLREVSLSGFSNIQDGYVSIVSVPSSNTFVIAFDQPVTLTGNELVTENVDNGVVGWHVASVLSDTVIEFDTPPTVEKDYVPLSVSAVADIRCWGTLNLETALHHLINEKDDGAYYRSIERSCMFITPLESVSVTRDASVKGSGVSEVGPSVHLRQLIQDGFMVYVAVPVSETAGAVKAIDMCQGDVFRVVLRTFNWLVVHRPELPYSAPFAAMLKSHKVAHFDGANYVHAYEFEVNTQITNADGIQSFEVSDSIWKERNVWTAGRDNSDGSLKDSSTWQAERSVDEAAAAGGVYKFGKLIFREADLGLKLQDQPQPLTAHVYIGDQQ